MVVKKEDYEEGRMNRLGGGIENGSVRRGQARQAGRWYTNLKCKKWASWTS